MNGAAGRKAQARPDETEAERADRNFTELLQELRVAQTGVQILFAFLLTLPFTNRFDLISQSERVIYLITLLAAAMSSALLIAPVALHRWTFRMGMKEAIVGLSDRLALSGLGFMVIALVGALFLIVDVVAGRATAVVLTGAAAAVFVLLWGVVPLRYRAASRDD